MKSCKKNIDNLIFYDIYPTSFYDSNGDGTGDFKGISEKLDYVSSLGVNAIWLNPFYKSPFNDGGYDICDYYSVDPRFGTMEDFENLIKDCKKRGLKVFIDLVIGHTSDEHPWFIDSCKKERNEHSDWYIWTTNLITGDERCVANPKERDGCYRINYYFKQPALNFGFENPDESKPWQWHYTDPRLKPLRDEIINMMKFWCAKGVAGFRCDMALYMVKGGKTHEGDAWLWNKLIGEVRKEYPYALFLAEGGDPAVSVGKCGFDMDYLTHDVRSYNALIRNEKGMNIASYMELGDNYFSENGRGNVKDFLNHTMGLDKEIADKGSHVFGTGNHDLTRVSEGKSEEMLKLIFAFVLTWKSVPLIYYGDEIYMKYMRGIHKDGGTVRTGSRTPMQWSEAKNRGFSVADKNLLYLPVNEDGESVEKQEKRGNSLLHVVRKLTELHKKMPYSAGVKVIEDGYPLIYERHTDSGIYTVFIQPAKARTERVVDYGKTLIAENCTVNNGKLTSEGVCFAIFHRLF